MATNWCGAPSKYTLRSPALIVSGTVTAHERALAADAFLPKGAASPVELLERIRVLVARKRGPKKQLPAPTPPAYALTMQPAASQPGEPSQLEHPIAS